jgi:teichuronic acid biosynthesis protein TuaE
MNWKIISYLCLLIFVFTDAFFFNIAIGPLHITAIRVIIGVLTIIMLLRYFVLGDPIIGSSIRYPVFFLFIWFFYGMFSLIWTTDKTIGVKELYYFSTFILFILQLIYLLQIKNQEFWVKDSFWAVGMITVIICLLEIATNHHFSTSRYVIETERLSIYHKHVATAYFYNENDLSLFLVIIAPFFMVRLLSSSLFKKLFNIIFILLIFVIISFNAARLAFLALLLQLMVFFYLTQKKWFFRCVRLAILFLPIIIALAWHFLGSKVSVLFDVKGFEAGYGSGFERMNLYLNGFYSTFQSFMLGVGPGNYGVHMYPQFYTGGIVNPHNWWIEVLTNYGFLIFCGYLVFFWFNIKNTFIIYKDNRENNQLGLALFLSFVGFIPACIGPSSLFYHWPMWLLFGVSLAYINVKKVTTSKSMLFRKVEI